MQTLCSTHTAAIKLMASRPKTAPDLMPDLFHKDGVYYLRLRLRMSGEHLEIALHGISSEEKARSAAKALVLENTPDSQLQQ